MKQRKLDLNARMNLALKKHRKDFKHKHKCIVCFADGYFEGELTYYNAILKYLKQHHNCSCTECFEKAKHKTPKDCACSRCTELLALLRKIQNVT